MNTCDNNIYNDEMTAFAHHNQVAKAMSKQNGMKQMTSRVFVVKTHAKMQTVVDSWASQGFSCTIVEDSQISIVGGWRTVAALCKKPDWVCVHLP